jgi:NAD(P)-dependent dehydrogenase (short-subunit alcohol dehydrogenase family)
MDLGIKGKTALVTGSSVGIGYSIAKILSQEGVIVYVNGRSRESVQSAIDSIKKEGAAGELRPAPYDLSGKSGVDALLKSIPDVDILINNLGIYEIKPFEEITDEDWLRLFEINVLSGIRLSRAYFPKMRAKSWGRIVFISSESGVNTPVEMVHYGVTKTAQLAVARGLAETTVGTGITVNSVLPGPTYSKGVEAFVQQMADSKGVGTKQIEEEFFKTVRPSSLIKRFATSDEVAALVAFVCGKSAAAVNGAALRVDGGVIHSII